MLVSQEPTQAPVADPHTEEADSVSFRRVRGKRGAAGLSQGQGREAPATALYPDVERSTEFAATGTPQRKQNGTRSPDMKQQVGRKDQSGFLAS